MWFILEHQLSLWKSGILVYVDRECLYDRLPEKTLGTQSVRGCPARQHFTIQCLRKLRVSHVTSLREESWKRAPDLLQTLPHTPFPFDDFALYLDSAHHSGECNYMMSPSSESPNLEVIFGTFDTVFILSFIQISISCKLFLIQLPLSHVSFTFSSLFPLLLSYLGLDYCTGLSLDFVFLHLAS